MANLYDIDAAILACIDTETGEIIDPEKLEGLQLDREKKLENVALWVKNLKADIAAYKAEKQAFADKVSVCERRLESLEKYLSDALGGANFKTARVACNFRKSESISITDIKSIGSEYLKFAEPTPDKKAIKDAIKSGKEISGAELVSSLSLSVK